MNYGGSYKGEARITIASILLLAIFVSAAALIIVAAIWRPWSGDSSSSAQTNQPQATVTVASNTVAQAPAGTPDPNAPTGP
jgi:ABC-type Fe3+ transport system permease subunit